MLSWQTVGGERKGCCQVRAYYEPPFLRRLPPTTTRLPPGNDGGGRPGGLAGVWSLGVEQYVWNAGNKMTPDPKWLEILKASGWQTTALAGALGLFLILLHTGLVPKPSDPLWVYVPALAFLIFAFLSLAAIGDALVKVVEPVRRINLWRAKRHDQQKVRDFIPYMTDADKKIIAYLLHHRQKIFPAADDGGYAAPLIAKGIVRLAGVPGQRVDFNRVPFEIPDHIWDVLEQHSDQFPYAPPKDEKGYPWAVSWLVR